MTKAIERAAITKPEQIKVFVLYLMHNIGYPLTFGDVNDIVRQTDYISALDFTLNFGEMAEEKLITVAGKTNDNEELFAVSPRGMLVAGQLSAKIDSRLLDDSLKHALRYLDFKKRGVKIQTAIKRQSDGTANLRLILTDRRKTVLETTLNVDSEGRANKMRDWFSSHPEDLYRGLCALLGGNVDYLFDDN